MSKNDCTEEEKAILKELAPYIDEMKYLYNVLLVNLEKQNADEPELTACYGAIMGGLSASRKNPKVTEKVDTIMFAAEVFRVMVSVEKLMALGVLTAKIDGCDDCGWPIYKITEEPDMKKLFDTEGGIT